VRFQSREIDLHGRNSQSPLLCVRICSVGHDLKSICSIATVFDAMLAVPPINFIHVYEPCLIERCIHFCRPVSICFHGCCGQARGRISL
jgi:hypothetical protein